jgi:hypothetical protein
MFRRLLDAYWSRIERKALRDPVIEALKHALDIVGKRFEAMSYDELCKPAEELSFTIESGGMEMTFSAEAFDTKPNGDLGFCIDASTPGRRFSWQPSYQFYKRRDGSVYHAG